MRKTHQTLKRVTNDFEIALAFQHVRGADDGTGERCFTRRSRSTPSSPVILKRVFAICWLLMLSPMAPHIAEELVGNAGA